VSTHEAYRQPLGVGGIVGDAIGIYFQRFGLMFALSVVPALIALVLTELVPTVSEEQAAADPASAGWPFLVAWIIQFFAASLVNSLIVLAAFDTKIGRPGRLGVYVQWALANLFTVIVLSIAVVVVMVVPAVLVGAPLGLIAAAIGLTGTSFIAIIAILGVLSALYLWSALSPVVPAIVIEGIGFRALGRAWRLTAGYRWPVVGAIIVLFITAAVVGLIGGLIGRLAASIETTLLPDLISLVMGAISSGILAVGIAMIYARLRGLKEGLDVESLADVFR
jgi:hypothetical protein